MKQWFVLQVLSGQEKKAYKTLQEQIDQNGIRDLVEEILLPTENVSEVKNGQNRIVEKKLWPGYLLIKMTLTDETWTVVKHTNGVVGFLGGSERPTPLSDKEVEEILNDLKAKKDKIVQKYQFEVGNTVKIIDGVFENFLGTVNEVNPEKGRLSVTVSIFGRDTRVDDLKFSQVEEVSEDAEID